MLQVGPNACGTQAQSVQLSSGSNAWSNLGNVTALDGSSMTITLATSATSQYVVFSNFGFSVPSNATIVGVVAEGYICQSVTGGSTTSPRLFKGGVSTGGNPGGSLFQWTVGSSPTYTSMGLGQTDLWGATLTPTDVNASSFGFGFFFTNSGLSNTATVDFVRLTVYYTLPGSTTQTVSGTAGAWRHSGTGVNNHGSSNATIAFAAKLTDGSANNPSHSNQNLNYVYGEDHTTGGGTTAPVEIAVTPGAVVYLTWASGLVHTGAGIGTDNAGDNGPSGSWQTDESSGAGNTTYPYLTGTYPNYGPSLESSNSGVSFPGNYVTNCHTRIGGLCGVFTNSTHDIIAGSFWDFEQWCVGGTQYAITAVAAASGSPLKTVYTGTFANGGSNALAGLLITVSGCGKTNGANNGTFYCTGSSTTTITLNNPNGVAESSLTAKATTHTTAVIYAPTDATTAFISIGMMDSKPEDNSGSMSINVAVLDQASNPDPVTFFKGVSGFIRYPFSSIIGNGDGSVMCSSPANYVAALYMQTLNALWLDLSDANGLNSDKNGQLYPHGGQVRNGQVWPF